MLEGYRILHSTVRWVCTGHRIQHYAVGQYRTWHSARVRIARGHGTDSAKYLSILSEKGET
eukprot:906033-Rhodomonas_salina.1